MKRNKLVIAVILALIVCLVLIPTCAFADGEQLVQQSAAGEGGSDNGAGDTSPGDNDEGQNLPDSGDNGAADPASGDNSSNVGDGDGTKVEETIVEETKGNDTEESKVVEEGTSGAENGAPVMLSGTKGAPTPAPVSTGLWTSDSGKEYDSLQDAVDKEGEAVNLTLNRDGDGHGLMLKAGSKTVTINFDGHTYNVNGELVGSPGTESQAFHLERGNTVTLMNGTLTSDKAKMIIQNYCDLTLIDMNIDGTKSAGCSYVVSNNNGSLTVNGSTDITANEGACAFDVYYWPPYYEEGVTVNINTTGTITGKIEYTSNNTPSTKNVLNISSGTLNGEIYVQDNLKDNAAINPTGGVYTDENILDYVNEDAVVVTAGGKFAVNESGYALAKDAHENDEAIEVVKAPANAPIDDVPAGVKIVNNSGNTIYINGVEVKKGETYTVPEPKPAEESKTAASAPLYAKYFVIEGKNAEWTKGSNADLKFVLNSKDVVKVLIDGAEVEFTVAEDGTVTIAAAVIEALEAGTHEIQFIFADGSCMTTFTK